MGGVISKRLNQGIIDLKQLEDLRKAKLLQIGVFVIGVLLNYYYLFGHIQK